MTWILRLLPDQSGLRRRANRHDKNRMASAHRRHRKPTLEAMEQRLVLAGGITIPPIDILGGPLTITGDTNGDNIPIHVNSAIAGGTVSVGPTFINGSFQTFTTLGAVTSINILLPGGGNNTPNTVTITGPGKNLPTTLVERAGEDARPSTSFRLRPEVPFPTGGTQPLVHALSLTITGVNSSGGLDVEQLGNTPASAGTAQQWPAHGRCARQRFQHAGDRADRLLPGQCHPGR